MPHYRFSFVMPTGEAETVIEAVCGDDTAALRQASALLLRDKGRAVEVWRAAEYLGTLAPAPSPTRRRAARPARLAPFVHAAHRVMQ